MKKPSTPIIGARVTTTHYGHTSSAYYECSMIKLPSDDGYLLLFNSDDKVTHAFYKPAYFEVRRGEADHE